MNIKQLKETAQELFSKRTNYLMLLQELAENFYPQRADFTLRKEYGEEFADNLMTSYPLLASRDLSDQVGVMLRPTEKEWFKIVPDDEERNDLDAKRWLEWATKQQRKAMYDPKTLFNRATKEADRDFSTFGQSVISVRLNRERNRLLYLCWHLRDVAWKENEECQIGLVVRKWNPTLLDLTRLFPNCHENVRNKASSKPFEKVNCYHIVCESDMYDQNSKGRPWFSIYYDIDNDYILEEVPVYYNEYVIPRWQTVAGSQYAYSPAAIAALPDARLIQSMTYTLLEAGEKAVNPPLAATKDAVKSDVNAYAGGITWIAEEYDERLGAALRPIANDSKGIPLGMDMSMDAKLMIREAFYLNKLTLPQRAPEMTAYEVGQRIQEYIRGALPIFEPMESEYNGAICEKTFDLLLRTGGFGSVMDMPKSLSGADVTFKFESPLHDAIEAQKGQTFIESQQLLAEAAALDRSVIHLMDAKTALRDVLSGIGTPSKWLRSEEDVQNITNAEQQQMQIAQTLAAMEQGAGVAETLSNVNVG